MKFLKSPFVIVAAIAAAVYFVFVRKPGRASAPKPVASTSGTQQPLPTIFEGIKKIQTANVAKDPYATATAATSFASSLFSLGKNLFPTGSYSLPKSNSNGDSSGYSYPNDPSLDVRTYANAFNSTPDTYSEADAAFAAAGGSGLAGGDGGEVSSDELDAGIF